MPRSVTPYLGNGLVPDGPKPAPGRPRLPKTVTVVHGRAILHPNASANAFVPVTINPVLPSSSQRLRNWEVGLTRRCSGLASLAAELHIVRRHMRPWKAMILRFFRLVFAIAASLLINGCPDLTIAFLATIEIRNDSGVDLFVTPLGSDEGGGGFRALPRYEGKGSSYRYSSLQSRILIPAGATLAYRYDTDDYNFRFLLLRSPRGVLKLLHTDFSTQLQHLCCFGPQQRSYVIPPLKGLPVAPRGVEACEQGQRAPTDLFAALYPSS